MDGAQVIEGQVQQQLAAPRPCRLLTPPTTGTHPSSGSRALSAEAHGPKASSPDPLSGVRDMLSARTGQSDPASQHPFRVLPAKTRRLPPRSISYLSFSLSASGMRAAGVQGSCDRQEQCYHQPSPAPGIPAITPSYHIKSSCFQRRQK